MVRWPRRTSMMSLATSPPWKISSKTTAPPTSKCLRFLVERRCTGLAKSIKTKSYVSVKVDKTSTASPSSGWFAYDLSNWAKFSLAKPIISGLRSIVVILASGACSAIKRAEKPIAVPIPNVLGLYGLHEKSKIRDRFMGNNGNVFLASEVSNSFKEPVTCFWRWRMSSDFFLDDGRAYCDWRFTIRLYHLS